MQHEFRTKKPDMPFPENVAVVVAHGAWRSKPCWFLIAEEDRMINPKTQQFMARRMGAKVRSSRVDHSPMLTAPDLVIDVIVETARESLSLAPLEIWGEPRWIAADPQLKEIRK